MAGPHEIEVRQETTAAEIGREAAQMLGASGMESLGLPALTPGRMMLLRIIGSPLVEEDGGEASAMDAVRALYVIAEGPGALRPVTLALRQEYFLERAEAKAQESPELYAAWCAAAAAAAQGWGDFDQAALEWLDRSGISDLQEGLETLREAFADAQRAWSTIMEAGEGHGPLASDTPTLRSGQQTCTRSVERDTRGHSSCGDCRSPS